MPTYKEKHIRSRIGYMHAHVRAIRRREKSSLSTDLKLHSRAQLLGISLIPLCMCMYIQQEEFA